MKKLTLIRHAKSSWKDTSLADHDRPLNKRGRRDLTTIALALSQGVPLCERVYCSTALRAHQTAVGLAPGLACDSLYASPELYTFSAPALITFLQRLPDELKHIALVGHNPACQELLIWLTGEEVDRYPTCAVADIQLRCSHWETLEKNCGSRIRWLTPKRLQDKVRAD